MGVRNIGMNRSLIIMKMEEVVMVDEEAVDVLYEYLELGLCGDEICNII